MVVVVEWKHVWEVYGALFAVMDGTIQMLRVFVNH